MGPIKTSIFFLNIAFLIQNLREILVPFVQISALQEKIFKSSVFRDINITRYFSKVREKFNATSVLHIIYAMLLAKECIIIISRLRQLEFYGRTETCV